MGGSAHFWVGLGVAPLTHSAHFKNAASTALELGHHDSRVTFAHYRELVKPKDAERYWNIGPAAAAKKVVHMTPTASG
jgi:hypothetical protein